jgi:hypothetical protein
LADKPEPESTDVVEIGVRRQSGRQATGVRACFGGLAHFDDHSTDDTACLPIREDLAGQACTDRQQISSRLHTAVRLR